MKQLQGRPCNNQGLELLPIVYLQLINYNPSEREKDARINCVNILNFTDCPLSLQSLCRLSIRSHIGPQRFCQIGNLSVRNNEENWIGLAPHLIDFLEYRQLFLSVGQIPAGISLDSVTHTSAIKKLVKVLKEVKTAHFLSLNFKIVPHLSLIQNTIPELLSW